jgi:uncharacterized heparinase superfamily protein
LNGVARYLHTVRHLRPVQVFGRLWYQMHRPRPELRFAPVRRAVATRYAEPLAPAASLIAPDTFRLLNVERRCATAADWQPVDASKLWTYHLHYFEDLNARDSGQRMLWHDELLQRWVRENSPGTGVAWEPYPLSRRMVSWIKWALRGNHLPAACHQSLAVQARWLTKRLEYHILGNHLLANATALMHAGLYFEGPEARSWYEAGRKLVQRELSEQLLSDGGHFELSPMYHAIVLGDLLDLLNLHRAFGREVPGDWGERIAHMQLWLETMTHPDGEIAYFNDAVCGTAATAEAVAAYASRLKLPSSGGRRGALTELFDSGYVRAERGPAVLICDCADIGPDYLPAHAHADTLSFELSLFGRRVLVNSGVSQYGADAERLRQRGTPAHNTVVVDGLDSSEVWGGFRTARRARVSSRSIQELPNSVSVEATHDGYLRLPGRNRHSRRWELDEFCLKIEDRISGTFGSADAFFHLHPNMEARKQGSDLLIHGPQLPRPLHMTFTGAAAVEIRNDRWHGAFGHSMVNSCVVASFASDVLGMHLSWGDRI